MAWTRCGRPETSELHACNIAAVTTSASDRKDVERWLDYQLAGIHIGRTELVQFRCGECRKQRRVTGASPDKGQLLGTARKAPDGIWWWFPRHMSNSRGPKTHRALQSLSSTGPADTDNYDLPMRLQCHYPSHQITPRLPAWMCSRASRAIGEGFNVVHV